MLKIRRKFIFILRFSENAFISVLSKKCNQQKYKFRIPFFLNLVFDGLKMTKETIQKVSDACQTLMNNMHEN